MRPLRASAAAAVLALAFVAPAPRAAADVERIALDLREQVDHIAVTERDLYGRQGSGSIPLTIFRPPGDGPFPLAVVAHGRAGGQHRAEQGRQRFEALARYLVAKGFAVVVPTRLGYGETYGDFDPEDVGTCSAMRIDAMAAAASDQLLAAQAYASRQPWADATRWIAIGQSVGGLATVALVARQPPGLVAAINFSGGMGGDPERRPGAPCVPEVIEQAWKAAGGGTSLAMLWLYWRNDRYWGPVWPQRWAEAWRSGGGRLQFHRLEPAGSDGHRGIEIDMDHWVPFVEAYLGDAGFARPGLPSRPPPSGHAGVGDIDRVPAGERDRESHYRRFLELKRPRAFAIGPGGAVGWAGGDWAIGRALGNCQWARGVRCRLYAVDDDVVWEPERP